MGFFGYWGEKMDDAIAGLKTDISAMKVDAETYEKEAKRLEDEAKTFEETAVNEEQEAAALKLTKTVTSSTPNEDGTYDEEEVDDEDAIKRKEGLLADAKKKREDAAKDRENAAEYRTLAAGLWLLKGNMEEAAKNWELARENIKAAIVNSTKSLETGINMLRNAISTFNIPSVKSIGNWANNLLKKYVGIDLSDGFGADDLYRISGKLIETGSIAVKGFASLAVISTIGVLPGLGEISLDIINDFINPTIDKIFDEDAVKVVYNGFTSGLGFLGITFEEEEGTETAAIGTEDIQDQLGENDSDIIPGGTTTPEAQGDVVENVSTVTSGDNGNNNGNKSPTKPTDDKEYELAVKQYENDRDAREGHKIEVANTKIEMQEAKKDLDYAQKVYNMTEDYDTQLKNQKTRAIQNGDSKALSEIEKKASINTKNLNAASKELGAARAKYDWWVNEHAEARAKQTELETAARRSYNNMKKLEGSQK